MPGIVPTALALSADECQWAGAPPPWVAEKWPQLVQTPNAQSLACFIDDAGVKLTPPVRRTWAPKGRTPVLRHRSQLGHQPTTVMWDNLGAHHARALQQWAATQPWLVVEYLPSYAPELNLVEGLWANLKGCELANRCCADRTELIARAQVGSIRVRRDPDLLRSFLAGTGLTL